ncbi:MAG: hypothetical protein DSY42_01705, partial [Aquifex sp.]
KRIFFNIDELPKARIEKIGSYYTIRVGLWKTKEEANEHLKKVKIEFPNAFIRTCYYIKERIILTNDKVYQFSDLPFNIKRRTITISGEDENEKICKAVLHFFRHYKNIVSSEKKYKKTISFKSIYPYSVADALNRVITLYKKEGFVPIFCKVSKEDREYNLALEGFFVKEEDKEDNIVAVDFESVRENNGNVILDIIYLSD